MKNMVKKNTRKNRPVKISLPISEFAKNNLSKFSKIEFILFSKWQEMVGDFFSQYTEPEKIYILRNNNLEDENDNYQGILKVNIIGAAALDFQHFNDKIKDKINSFFGYEVVTKIKLNQVPYIQNNKKNLLSKNNKALSKSDKETIKKVTSEIKSKNLEKALANLGKSILIDKD